MKLENILQIIMEISEKFNTYEEKNRTSLYYDVLHMSLSSIIKDMTEEQYLTIPQPYRTTIEEMEELILMKTSKKYSEQWKECLSTKGRFRKINKDNKRIVSGVKQNIGFKVEFEEGTSV